MAQLDIYENLNEDSRAEIPYLLDIQHVLHQHLRTRMIVPLVRTEAQKARLDTLCPGFVIEGQSVFASIPEMSAYPVKELGDKVYNLEVKRSEIFSAVDFMLNGFKN
jgi:toxin CcdB